MAYQSGLINDTMTRLNRRRSLTGRSLTSAEVTGIVDPMLAYEAQKAEAAGEREARNKLIERELDMREHAQEQADRAATISGIGELGMGGANLYFANKYLNILGGKGGLTGAGAAPLASPAATNFAVPALTAPGPLVAGGAAGGGMAGVGGAAGGAAIPFGSGTTTASLAVPTTFGETTAGLTAGGATGAGLGLAGIAGAGAVGGLGGYGLSKLLGSNTGTAKAVGMVGAGAGIGFMVGGPVGAIAGGLIGGAASFLDHIF